MESPLRFRARAPCLLHHHHHCCSLHHHRHHHPICHCHHHHFCSSNNHYHHHRCNCHSLLCARFAPHPLQGPEPLGSCSLQNDMNLQDNVYGETSASIAQSLQEPGLNGLEDQEEEEEEPIFVLTDEWREFFAKSEAKRKLEKQQAKKKRQTLVGKAGHTLDVKPSNAQA